MEPQNQMPRMTLDYSGPGAEPSELYINTADITDFLDSWTPETAKGDIALKDIRPQAQIIPVADSYSTDQIDKIIDTYFEKLGMWAQPFDDPYQQDGALSRIYLTGHTHNDDSVKAKEGVFQFLKVGLRGDPKIFLDENKSLEDIASKTEKVPAFYDSHEIVMGNGRTLSMARMEVLDGLNAERYLGTHPELTTLDVLQIFKGMVEAAGEVHKAGYVHRDLKPSNFMIKDLEDKNGHKKFNVRLIDVGTATRINEAPKSELVHGTPEYMSQDHFVNNITTGMDIHSLGCTLYQMLLGPAPYEHVKHDVEERKKSGLITPDKFESELKRTLYAAIDEQVHFSNPNPEVKEQLEGMRDELYSILSHTLSNKKDERYESCDALGAYVNDLIRTMDVENISEMFIKVMDAVPKVDDSMYAGQEAPEVLGQKGSRCYLGESGEFRAVKMPTVEVKPAHHLVPRTIQDSGEYTPAYTLNGITSYQTLTGQSKVEN
ncbi:serine/threonine protein kinase [Nanoarchaeota archaeon]